MSVRIIVDSTADLTPELKERLLVVPLTIHFEEDEYLDGVTIDRREFYEKLIESDVLPKTSQPSPAAFASVYEEVTKAGDSAVVLTVASSLSGTYQSATIAAEDYDNIYVVDSQSAAIGSAILAELALQLADSGMDAKSIADRMLTERDKVYIVAMLDTLEYLKKGGRISKTVAFAGGILSIKPVVCLDKGEIVMLGKARGSKQGNNLLVTEIAKAGGVDFDKPVLLGYTGLSDLLLQKYVEDSKALWADELTELRSTIIGSAIGTHVGPGAIAVAFFKK
ncbi:MAG: DegV family protein [Lachnospiraceae bacterium]|nr:DegV family protein [Lachnospiraceae bacterium]